MKVRDAVIALPGYKIVEIDYSQLETYCLAAMSHDAHLIKCLIRGDDLHAQNLEAWIAADDGNAEGKDRRGAKSLSFGLAYGETPWGMERKKGIPRKEAQAFIDGYYATYPGVHDWHDDLVNDAANQADISDLKIEGIPVKEYVLYSGYGKSYYFTEDVRNNKRTGKAETSFKPTYLKNYPIQGIASDIIRFALAELWRVRRAMLHGRGFLINTIHDSILLMVKDEHMALVPEVERLMCHVPLAKLKSLGFNWPRGLPLRVDAEVGNIWTDMYGAEEEEGIWYVKQGDDRVERFGQHPSYVAALSAV